MRDLAQLDRLIITCRACPRLVAWREEVAEVKRASFADETYWGKPVPGFGPAGAAIMIVGLAPAAHGANRTGRMFTGDRSGDFLFASMHRVGLANQPDAVSMDDGLELRRTRISSPVRCAPPQNKPTPAERRTCSPFLGRELELTAPTLKTVVVLGAFGWQALFSVLTESGWQVPVPRPAFGHGAQVVVHHSGGRTLTILGCFHVSQHNTFTGRLTPGMLDEVLTQAKQIAGIREGGAMSTPQVRVRRIYDDPDPDDGSRILVDRLWPRGVSKARAHLDDWCRNVAPSTDLRTWYSHDPDKFGEFAERYRAELETDDEQKDALAKLREVAADGPLTLLTATKQPQISEAEVLRRVLTE